MLNPLVERFVEGAVNEREPLKRPLLDPFAEEEATLNELAALPVPTLEVDPAAGPL